MAEPQLLREDRERFLTRTAPLWVDLRGSRIFITGGTGFFGCWLVESFLWANRELGLGAKAVSLTRDEAAFRRRHPRLASADEIAFHPGDIRSFEFPRGDFFGVIHAAADAAETGTIVEGTRRALDFAKASRAKAFLLASSGAVYGRQPAGMTYVAEDFLGAPDPDQPRAAYGEAKRLAERLCAETEGVEAKIARGFAFAGPYLPLDGQYAIGNFIRDAVKGEPILVKSDGTVIRSYLYGADLAAWLWTIFLRGKTARPYNVGSEDAVSVGELAHEVALAAGGRVEVRVLGKPEPGRPAERYVPSTARAREELELRQTVGRREAIERMLRWVSSEPRTATS